MLLNQIWYGPFSLLVRFLRLCLLPFSILFWFISAIRRFLYKSHIFKSKKIPVTVVIVGGITVGGAGKTPLSIALIEELYKKGYKVGLISRGYKSKQTSFPYEVLEGGDVSLCGDEPLLIKNTVKDKAKVFIDPIRSRGSYALYEKGCDVILSDDGLQHYALNRSLEIAVLDGKRLWGNGLFLPAGPLREGLWRLKTVDFVVVNGESKFDFYNFKLKPQNPVALKDGTPLMHKTVIALSGIANPERFYKTCENLGLTLVKKVDVLDHHSISKEELLKLSQNYPVVMTSKDAVKYAHMGIDNLYELKVLACIEGDFVKNLLNKLEACKKLMIYKI